MLLFLTQVTESVDAINAAIQILAQKAQALQRENQNKMTHLRYMLKVIPFPRDDYTK